MSWQPSKQHDVEFADLRPGRILESRFISDPAEMSDFMALVFGRSSRIRADETPREIVEVVEIVDWPFYDEKNSGWKVMCRTLKGGYEHEWFLSDMGVLPYDSGYWNARTLTIVEMEVTS